LWYPVPSASQSGPAENSLFDVLPVGVRLTVQSVRSMRRGAPISTGSSKAERLNNTRKAIDASPESMRQMSVPILRRPPAPKSPRPATGPAALFSRLRRKQLTQVLIDLADRIRVGAEQREMSINGLDRPELRVGDEAPFGLAIRRREKHV